MVAKLTDRDVRYKPWTCYAFVDRLLGHLGCHDALTAVTGVFFLHMAFDDVTRWHMLVVLEYIFARFFHFTKTYVTDLFAFGYIVYHCFTRQCVF